MISVLVANSEPTEAENIMKVLGNDFKTFAITSPEEIHGVLERCDLILLDQNFTDSSGIDVLIDVTSRAHLPILMVTSPEDPECAIEAVRSGAHNYLVKTVCYYDLLDHSIKEAISKFNQHEEMKQTIIALKKRVNELEESLSVAGKQDVQTSSSEEKPAERKESMVEDIISSFKRGEINLPSLPQITVRFREMVNRNANLQEIADLLKQDVAITSKLISVSNSAYYAGIAKNETLDQAISRLGINSTKQYVYAVSNRALYTTSNKKYVELMEELWEHSLACAYASQVVSEALKLRLPDDAFTLGMLHDIGRLVLLQVVSELETRGKYGEGADRAELFNTLDSHHGKFGAALLKKWGFSTGYVHVAMHHDNLEDADPISKELLVVHFANLLVKSMGYAQAHQGEIDIEHVESASLLKIDSTMIAYLENEAYGRMEEMRQILV